MIKTAINGSKYGQLGAHDLNEMAGSHKSKGKFRPSLRNSSLITYEQIWSLHSRQFSDFLIQDFDLILTVLWNLLLATMRNYSSKISSGYQV